MIPHPHILPSRNFLGAVPRGRADVAHQLHVVLADVNHVQDARVSGEQLAADGRADCPRPADDEEAGAADCLGEERIVYCDVVLEQQRCAADEVEDVVLYGIMSLSQKIKSPMAASGQNMDMCC